ncbi:unnamed protein product, partial [Ectocarpus fasciculatus]
ATFRIIKYPTRARLHTYNGIPSSPLRNSHRTLFTYQDVVEYTFFSRVYNTYRVLIHITRSRTHDKHRGSPLLAVRWFANAKEHTQVVSFIAHLSNERHRRHSHIHPSETELVTHLFPYQQRVLFSFLLSSWAEKKLPQSLRSVPNGRGERRSRCNAQGRRLLVCIQLLFRIFPAAFLLDGTRGGGGGGGGCGCGGNERVCLPVSSPSAQTLQSGTQS